MANIYYQQDCDLNKLNGKTVAIIGYGSQGHAHALNLKESGVDVVVGLYKGSKSWDKAEKQGLKVYTAAEAAAKVRDLMGKFAKLKEEKRKEIEKNSSAAELTKEQIS